MRKAGKIFPMSQFGNKLVAELRQLSKKLAAMADSLESESEGPVKVPASIRAAVAEKMARKECLQCGRVLPDEPFRRGLCAKDYRKTTLRVDAGKVTYAALLVAGLIGPRGSGGRPSDTPTALDQFLQSGPSPAQVAEIESAMGGMYERNKSRKNKKAKPQP